MASNDTTNAIVAMMLTSTIAGPVERSQERIASRMVRGLQCGTAEASAESDKVPPKVCGAQQPADEGWSAPAAARPGVGGLEALQGGRRVPFGGQLVGCGGHGERLGVIALADGGGQLEAQPRQRGRWRGQRWPGRLQLPGHQCGGWRLGRGA